MALLVDGGDINVFGIQIQVKHINLELSYSSHIMNSDSIYLIYFKIRTFILLQKLRQTLQIKLKTREKNAGIIVAVYKVVAHGAEVKECAVELIG